AVVTAQRLGGHARESHQVEPSRLRAGTIRAGEPVALEPAGERDPAFQGPRLGDDLERHFLAADPHVLQREPPTVLVGGVVQGGRSGGRQVYARDGEIAVIPNRAAEAAEVDSGRVSGGLRGRLRRGT